MTTTRIFDKKSSNPILIKTKFHFFYKQPRPVSTLLKGLIRWLVHIHYSLKLYNIYRPAECTIATTYPLITSDTITSNELHLIPIGRPIPGVCCAILDEQRQFVSIDETGELYISGPGLFAGYFNRDDLTNQVLFEINGKKYYKTGDLVIRDDFQIKLRGKRIEVREIEKIILKYFSSISNCIVIKTINEHNSHEYLVAYIQSTIVQFTADDLAEYCHRHLREYMVPSAFIKLHIHIKLPGTKS
jgi:acyl-coenzyme A synthetase/AMP-(fatty) acid ligase